MLDVVVDNSDDDDDADEKTHIAHTHTYLHQMNNGTITFAIAACGMHFTRVQNYEALMSIQFREAVCDFSTIDMCLLHI